MGFQQKKLKRLRRALFQDHLLYFAILNKLTDYKWKAMQAWMKTTKHLVLETYAGMLGDPNYINTIVRRKGQTTKCKCKLIHEDGTVSAMGNRKTRCEGTWKRSIFYRSHPLESWHREADPTATQWLPSWWTHGSRRNSFVISYQLRFLAACHQVRNHQEQRRRMKQWSVMAAEELGFEGGQMHVDEGSMLRTQSWKRKEHDYWSQDQELQTRCKQPSWKSFVNMNSEQIQQLSVDRRGGDSSVSRGAWADEAGCHFSNKSSSNFLTFLKPEDDSYKGRVQWDLEDRMMRMMSRRRTTFSGNKIPAGLEENLNLNLRWRLRFQANIVRWNSSR